LHLAQDLGISEDKIVIDIDAIEHGSVQVKYDIVEEFNDKNKGNITPRNVDISMKNTFKQLTNTDFNLPTYRLNTNMF
jgi:hypothetical protein